MSRLNCRALALLGVLALSTALPRAVQAQETPLGDTLALVKKNKFEEAIPRLKDLVYGGTLSGQTLVRARSALAQSYYYTNKIESARYELKLLLQKAPQTSLDRDRTPPDFLAFFDTVKSESVVKRAAVRTKTDARVDAKEDTPLTVSAHAEAPRALAEPSSAPALPASVPVGLQAPRLVRATYVEAPWYLKVIPFGGGQFANGDATGGGVFLGVTTALVAANVALSIVNATSYDAQSRTFAPPASIATYWAQNATAGAAIVAAAVGVVDAFVWSPARARARWQQKNADAPVDTAVLP